LKEILHWRSSWYVIWEQQVNGDERNVKEENGLVIFNLRFLYGDKQIVCLRLKPQIENDESCDITLINNLSILWSNINSNIFLCIYIIIKRCYDNDYNLFFYDDFDVEYITYSIILLFILFFIFYSIHMYINASIDPSINSSEHSLRTCWFYYLTTHSNIIWWEVKILWWRSIYTYKQETQQYLRLIISSLVDHYLIYSNVIHLNIAKQS
jgi:hypothetical protein